MGITIRYNGPPSPGYLDDGETWSDDLGTFVGWPFNRRVTAGEAVTVEGDYSIVRQDPDDPAAYQPDAILVDTPEGQRVALARTLWSADGEPSAQDPVRDVLARVDGKPDRARTELAAEQARGEKARKTLVHALEMIIADAERPADTNAGE